MSAHDRPRLSRAALAKAGVSTLQMAPSHIVHVGIGAFHRAHQAWYTARADDAAEWGISAFTGRSAAVADALTPQGGVYTLVERGASGDRFEHIGSVLSVADGGSGRLSRAIAHDHTAVVTLTVTEGGYGLTGSGEPKIDDAGVAADLEDLRGGADLLEMSARSTAFRLLAGLEARRRTDGGPLTIIPCDNVPGNGVWLQRGLSAFAADFVPALVPWLGANASFVSTSVDRITPRVGEGFIDEVAEATGWLDLAPVVTEPFSDWVLSGEFVAGSPDWRSAGATVVPDIAAYESRKLWMLNGAHTILAAAGILRGHSTVAAAMSDSVCRSLVERFWDETRPNLPSAMDTRSYATALLARFSNVRMEHQLAQISSDAVGKIRVRILPIVRGQLAAGRATRASAQAVAAWIECVRQGCSGSDLESAAITRALGDREPDDALLELIDPDLARVAAFRTEVLEALAAQRTGSASAPVDLC